MNVLFKRSASIATSASRQTLAALLRLTPSESFTSSSTSRSGIAQLNGSTVFEIRSREIHFATKSLEFRASDVVRAGFAMEDGFFDEKEKGSSSKKGGDEGLEIAKLGINDKIVRDLANRGITKLFPIQKAVLEPAMQGRDMIGRAKTGTGKTLAFGIPIIDKILQHQKKHGRGRFPLALVLAPTRELAKQVEKEFAESGRSAELDTLCVYGGVPIRSQMRTLDYGVDVVVGTPGRIIDLIKRGALNLREVQFVVLDEADQMLAVGFEEDVENILDNLPPKRQSMMFSATMPSWIKKLTQKYLKDPVTIDLVGENDQKLAEGITLYSIAADGYGKPSILGPLIKEHAKGGKCIIFTQTKRDADRLAYGMSRSFGCEPLHGDISQSQRERTLAGFRDGRFNILIATDVAARGLDIPNVDLIIHYELPNTSEIFVHRSGRTGRAGKKGSAILIYTNEQRRAVRGIEYDVGCKFAELPRITVEGGSEDFASMGGGRYNSFGGGGRMGSGDRMGSFSRGGEVALHLAEWAAIMNLGQIVLVHLVVDLVSGVVVGLVTQILGVLEALEVLGI
ncbi:uncharacterized protein A4U43_C07F34800 [Asparagus officinalis]|uniref:RNA helicase n=1 Tax=Asparagus officinalis TaxID=4686 RepID=A0A5P1EK80_ASPOF|nr:DEAD-box ATP-dependent RNA helicase 53-like [Asparagus officinalis]ONK65209.1 uncharacterized protein A4U43_C07F34800 [Asparagus officinalis]